MFLEEEMDLPDAVMISDNDSDLDGSRVIRVESRQLASARKSVIQQQSEKYLMTKKSHGDFQKQMT